MATKPKKPASKTTAAKPASTVTRISAVDTKPAKKAVTGKKVKKAKKVKVEKPTPKILKPFVMLGGYFKGAWFELRQVRWPNRRATWSLTGAVLLFTGFFVLLVVLLDVLFKYLFELILK